MKRAQKKACIIGSRITIITGEYQRPKTLATLQIQAGQNKPSCFNLIASNCKYLQCIQITFYNLSCVETLGH